MVHGKQDTALGAKISITAALICAACEADAEWATTTGTGPAGPIPIMDGGCSDEVKTAIREHVANATQCFSGVVAAPGLGLVASSSSSRSIIAPCSDDTSRVREKAQAIAQTALADVPAPSCALASLSIQGGLETEAAKLVNVLSSCGALSTLVLDACGTLHEYPAATLRIGDDGGVLEVAIEMLPSDPVNCGDAGPLPGDAGPRDASSPDAANLPAIECITRAVAGLTFPCHAGAKLCTISPYLVGPPV